MLRQLGEENKKGMPGYSGIMPCATGYQSGAALISPAYAMFLAAVALLVSAGFNHLMWPRAMPTFGGGPESEDFIKGA